MDHLYAPWRMSYITQSGNNTEKSSTNCVFCDKINSKNDIADLIVHRSQYVFTILNLFPYNNGHLMVVPYRHIGNILDVDDDILLAIMQETKMAIKVLNHGMKPDAYNVGINLGLPAGAGIVDHIHQHIVPRWNGDTNFMPVLSETKVLPDSLENSCKKIREAWNSISNG